MKRISFFLIILLCLITLSCSLDRDNPLDPTSNDNIIVPPMITGLALSSTVSGKVDIRCDRLQDIEQYRIYRSLSYDGSYTKIAELSQPVLGTKPYFIDNTVEPNGYYYYKVSGVIAGLEGPISPEKGVRVKI